MTNINELQDLEDLKGIQLVISAEGLKAAAENFAQTIYEQGYFDGCRDVKAANEIAAANKLYTTQEVTELLQVSRQTLYNWKKVGVCVPLKIGGAVRYTNEHIALMNGLKMRPK